MIKEIKISGEIKDTLQGDNRAIYSDCGGVIYIRDYILRECGGYNIGDRITISITPCEKDEYHYPPKPSI